MTVVLNGSGYMEGVLRLDTPLVIVTGSVIDLSQGNVFKKTIIGDVTLDVVNIPAQGHGVFDLFLENSRGVNVNFWPGVSWSGGIAPTLSAGVDQLRFTTSDGGQTWVGSVVDSVMGIDRNFWIATLGGASDEYGYGIAVDSFGNVYVTGRTSSQGAGSDDVLIAKYDTSGTLLWQRVLGGANFDSGYGIAVDSSGNVYVTGSTSSQGAGSDDVLIAKYDTSGTLLWQRVLGGASSDYGSGIAADSSGNVYVGGYTSSQGAGNLDVLIARLPRDGSGTGTYGNFTYATSTLTSATSTLTNATSTLTSATSTLTSATSTLTSATSTLLSSTTQG